MDKRQGIPFQNFVSVIERTFTGQDGVTLEVGKMIPDRTTGRLRDFDIVISSRVGYHQMTTAIECKDKGRRIDTPAVEAFAKKCERHGIGRKVMVSSSGFTKTAHAVAKDEKIDLMTLKEAEDFDWMAAPVLKQRKREWGECRINYELPRDEAAKIVEPYEVFDINGAPVSGWDIMASCEPSLSAPLDLPEGLQSEQVILEGPFALVDNSGARFHADTAVVTLNFTWSEIEIPFVAHEYFGDGGRFEVASAKADVFGAESNFVMRKQDDGRIGVYFVAAGVASLEAITPAYKSTPKTALLDVE